jgi:hypothetical protein
MSHYNFIVISMALQMDIKSGTAPNKLAFSLQFHCNFIAISMKLQHSILQFHCNLLVITIKLQETYKDHPTPVCSFIEITMKLQ